MNKSKSGISSLGTIRTFQKVGTRSETFLKVVDRSFNLTLKLEEHTSMLLAGGTLGQGYQCGQIWGAVLAERARAYQFFGPVPQTETAAVIAARRLVNTFRNGCQEINCLELTGADIKIPDRH